MKRFSCLMRSAAFGVAALSLVAASSSAHAGTIAGWDLTSGNGGSATPLAATTTATGITAGITRNGTVAYTSASYSFDSNGWQSSSTANNVEVSLSVSSGGPWDVTDFDFSYFRSGTGPSLMDIYTQVDGGALSLFASSPLSVGTSSGSSATSADLALNETFSSSLNVFFVADAGGLATGGTGTFRLNNPGDSASTLFQLAGTQVASPVPAPAAIPAALAGFALLGAGTVIRRRRIA